MATILAEKGLLKPRWGLAKAEAAKLADPYSSPPIPVLEIAESHGVDVIITDFGDAGDRVAGFCDFGSARLYVNAKDALTRQTFTMAHELGHWILHREFFDAHPERYQILPRFQRAAANDPFEQEANCFAANLLVPDRLLLPVKGAQVATLAEIFAVSREMMENRLKSV